MCLSLGSEVSPHTYQTITLRALSFLRLHSLVAHCLESDRAEKWFVSMKREGERLVGRWSGRKLRAVS